MIFIEMLIDRSHERETKESGRNGPRLLEPGPGRVMTEQKIISGSYADETSTFCFSFLTPRPSPFSRRRPAALEH